MISNLLNSSLKHVWQALVIIIVTVCRPSVSVLAPLGRRYRADSAFRRFMAAVGQDAGLDPEAARPPICCLGGCPGSYLWDVLPFWWGFRFGPWRSLGKCSPDAVYFAK